MVCHSESFAMKGQKKVLREKWIYVSEKHTHNKGISLVHFFNNFDDVQQVQSEV